MKKIRRILLLLVFIIAVGFFHNAPYLIIRFILGSQYKGIVPETSKDERHYLRQIQTAMEGYFNQPSNYIFEYFKKENYSKYPNLEGHNLYGFIGAKLGFSFWSWVFFSRTLFPIIAFFLLYRIFRVLGFSRHWSLNFALFNLITPYIVVGRIEFLFHHIFEFLQKRILENSFIEQIYLSEIPFSRLVNPNLTGLFYLSALLFLLRWLKKPQKYYNLFIMIIFLGICFKFYFYFWSALGAIIFGLLIVSGLRKDWRIFIPLLILFCICGIYSIHKFSGFLHPSVPTKLSYITMIASRKILISPAVFMSLLSAGILVLFKNNIKIYCRDSSLLNFIFAIPLIIFITMNQQLVTGRIVQPWHYELFTSPLLLSIFIFCVFLNRENINLFVGKTLGNFLNKGINLYITLTLFLLIIFLGSLQIFLLYFKFASRFDAPLLPVLSQLCTLFIFSLSIIFLICFVAINASKKIDFYKFSNFAFVFVFALIISEGINISLLKGLGSLSLAKKEQKYADALNWLNKQPAGVVMAHPTTSEIIPIFTHHFIYHSTFSTLYREPGAEENHKRLYHLLSFYNVQGEAFINYAVRWPYCYVFWGMKPTIKKSNLFNFGVIDIVTDDEKKSEAFNYMKERRTLLERQSKTFRLDYIFIGDREKTEFPFAPSLELVKSPPIYSDEYVSIYQPR